MVQMSHDARHVRAGPVSAAHLTEARVVRLAVGTECLDFTVEELDDVLAVLGALRATIPAGETARDYVEERRLGAGL